MLKIKDVSVCYGKYHALDHVSFEMKAGLYALLGPNGSGKSTLMKAICKQLPLTSGCIQWHDYNIENMKEEYFQILGYAPQIQGLYENMTGLQFLYYMAVLKGISKKKLKDEVLRVAQYVHMESHLKQKCKTYSGGMKQRLLIAQSLLGHPSLLLLDEPTVGLDPKERVALKRVLASLSQNHILLVTTHVVSDIEDIAQDILFLKDGQIVTQGSKEELLDCYHVTSLEDVYLCIFGDQQC